MSRLAALALPLALLACSSTTPPGSEGSAIAGTYATAVTLTQSTCTGITVQPNPTVIAHTAGSTTFTLTHAGQTYTGTLAANDAFTTAPRTIGTGATASRITIAGTFQGTGFTADVQVEQGTGTPQACAYTVHWVGTR